MAKTTVHSKGTLSVPVYPEIIRPVDCRPNSWNVEEKCFQQARVGTVEVPIEYQVRIDQAYLDRVAERSWENRSGVSVRGILRAEHGRVVDLDGSIRRNLATLARRAANNSGLKMAEGPVHVHVKLLETPAPVPARCHNCKKLATEHYVRVDVKRGGWNSEKLEYDPELEVRTSRYLCEAPAGTA